MVDCVFLLLIFFLVTSETPPCERYFQPAIHGRAIGNHPNIVRIWVWETPAGTQVKLGGPEGAALPDFPSLVTKLRSLPARTVALVQGPDDLTIQSLIRAVDAVAEAGLGLAFSPGPAHSPAAS